MTIMSFVPDWMRCKHLGADMYFDGSVLWIVAHMMPGPGSARAKLSQFWDLCKEHYRAHPDPNAYKLISLNMLLTNGRPKLKGKAAEVRALAPALLSALSAVMDAGNAQHMQIKVGLRCSHRMEQILSENKLLYGLPPEAAQELQQCILVYLTTFAAVFEHFKAAHPDLHLFNFTVKAHLLYHIALRA